MIARGSAALVALSLVAAADRAHAASAEEVLARVGPSTWSVKAYAAEEKLLASASGVVVAPGKLVTSCRVLAKATQAQLRRANSIYDARLEFPDVDRDLCQLEASGIDGPPPARGTQAARLGQRIYVIGYGAGNQLSIGEGIVSSVSGGGTDAERIRTSVPAARSLLGAGVFDDEGRLLGIVTSSPKDAPTTVSAVPARWLAELPDRGKAALAALSRPSPAASPPTPLPAAGATWTYGRRELLYSRNYPDLTVRVVRSDEAVVEEELTTGSRDQSGAQRAGVRRTVNAGEARYLPIPPDPSTGLIELAPYYFAATGATDRLHMSPPTGYPIGGAGMSDWKVAVKSLDWQQISVPAGTFRALRVRTTGERAYHSPSQSVTVSNFAIDVWYVPELKRYARLEHRAWWKIAFDSRLIGHDVLELLSYRPAP